MNRKFSTERKDKDRPGLFSAMVVGATLVIVLFAANAFRPSDVDEQTLALEEGELPAPMPATDGRRASASINEEYSWGLEIEGLNLRIEPVLAAEPFGGRVVHGESYEIVCWQVGERVTNGNDQNPTDDATTYASSLWWKILGPQEEAFIPDVWFARSDGDLLGAPECV